jgi:hypothetical protein
MTSPSYGNSSIIVEKPKENNYVCQDKSLGDTTGEQAQPTYKRDETTKAFTSSRQYPYKPISDA